MTEAMYRAIEKNRIARQVLQERFGFVPSSIMEIEFEDDRVIRCIPWGGAHIEDICESIVEMTRAQGKPVQVNFNGLMLTGGDGSARALIDYYYKQARASNRRPKPGNEP